MTSKSTELIHHDYRAPEGFESPVVPVHKASTVFFRDVAHLRSQRWVDKSGYTYGLHGTPTSFTLEARLATLEGGRHVLLAPSGLAAITLVDQALLSPGDEMLLPDNVYAPSLNFARHELARWGVTTRLYDPLDAASLRAAINPSTRLLWLEAPGSVTLEFPDLPELVRVAREAGRADLVLALDNTWGAGLAFNAFELGRGLSVDLTIHALTKYPSGGGDLLMGSVTTRSDALHEQLAWTHSRLGLGVGANDVEAVLRALPSMALALRGAGRRRAPRRALVRAAPRDRARAASGLARLARPRALGRAVQRRRRAAYHRVQGCARAGAGRCLRRRAAALSHRLELGRAGEPGGAL